MDLLDKIVVQAVCHLTFLLVDWEAQVLVVCREEAESVRHNCYDTECGTSHLPGVNLACATVDDGMNIGIHVHAAITSLPSFVSYNSNTRKVLFWNGMDGNITCSSQMTLPNPAGYTHTQHELDDTIITIYQTRSRLPLIGTTRRMRNWCHTNIHHHIHSHCIRTTEAVCGIHMNANTTHIKP